jgi:hypothetical protein
MHFEQKPKSKTEEYKDLISKELQNIFDFNDNDFLLSQQGGIERVVNKSLVPLMFRSPENISSSINVVLDYMISKNIPTKFQIDFFKAIQLSINDISLLYKNPDFTYENVQFAYQWAGLAKEKWELTQENIKEILDNTHKTFQTEKNKDDLPYLTSLYLDESNMNFNQTKIERFMQNITPNLIDIKNQIYHYNSTDDKGIFLKLDTEEKRKYVEDFLSEVKVGWNKMFEENPTIKMHTHYDLPQEFEQFLLPEKDLKDYFPHVSFNENSHILRSEMKNMLNPQVREILNKDLRIDLNELGAEQAYIVEYIANKKRKEIVPIRDFINQYNKVGLKTFLSCAHDIKMGDQILNLAEKLPEDSSRVLFQTYSDMVDATEEIGDILKENLGDKVTPELINSSKETLLIAGKNLLETYSKKASTCEGLDCETLGEELKERLSLAKKSVFAFSYVCKTLVEKGEFSFEDFKAAKLVYDQSPVAEEIAQKIIAMHDENTKQYPSKLGEKWRATLKNGLKNPNPDQLVVHVSFEDEVVSAMRVIKQEDGSWYGASFNVNPTVQGSKVGSELLKKVLIDLAKDKPFIADCYSKNPMLDTYLNKFGFQITKEMENYEDTGELVYQITLFPEKIEN